MNPTAFISYSWDDSAHQDWVKIFATKLRESGIESILDQWHTVPGDQLTEFMETAIRDNDRVLIVCTPNYKKKSDSRLGGVGYEGDIMTGEVFVKRNRKKFIPILARGSWEESAPSWLIGTYYIDLSDGTFNNNHFEKLVSTILQKNEAPPPVTRIKNITTTANITMPKNVHTAKVMLDILDLFRKSNSNAGHTLNERAFFHQHIIRYNPKEKEAINNAIAELEEQNVVELKNGKIFLTQSGVDLIYQ